MDQDPSPIPEQDRKRTLVIGLDGATFDILTPLLEAGFMPNLKQLIGEGVSGPLASVLPTNSAAAWCSFTTGKLPSRHGIYEFRHRPNGNLYEKTIVNSTFLRDEPVWGILSRHGLQAGVIAVPMTYPPHPLNGFMVTGLLTPKNAATFTYPPELSEELRGMHGGEYTFDVEWANYEGKEEELIEGLNHLSQVNLETTLHLATSNDWDFLITVFVSPDRLQHCFWPYIDPDFPKYDTEAAEKFYPLVQQHFAYLDNCIGQLLAKVSDDGTTVFVMSDHGFTGVYQQMVVDDWLAEQDLLKYRATRRTMLNLVKQIAKPIYHRTGLKNVTGRFRGLSQAADIDWSKTKAYCTWDQQQGISINLRGREPEGIVSPGTEYEQLLDQIESRLCEARDPKTGLPLFEQIIRGKEYYQDPIDTFTPDLIIIPGNHLRVAAPRQRRMYDSTGWATGDHAVPGIFVARGQGIQQGKTIQDALLIDLAPNILYTLDIPVPEDMNGRVLEHIFESSRLQARPPAIERVGNSQYSTQDTLLSEEEERELTERLRGLGYL